MPSLPMHHLFGENTWLRCDHDRTTLVDGIVRLATIEQVSDTASVDQLIYDAWMNARGGVVDLVCEPDLCPTEDYLLADPGGALMAGGEAGFRALPWRIAARPVSEPGGLSFGPVTEPEPDVGFEHPGALAADPMGRLWLLERPSGRILLLGARDLRVLDSIAPPPDSELIHLSVGSAGVLAADRAGAKLWFQPYGGEWGEADWPEPLPADAYPVSTVALNDGSFAALVRLATPIDDDGRSVWALLAIADRSGVRLFGLPGLEDPLHMLAMPDGTILVGEVASPVGSGMRFTQYELTDAGPHATDSWLLRRFDGRGLLVDKEGRAMGTTARGMRLMRLICPELESEGCIETYALDSRKPGAVWHRVFLDLDLPDGASVTISARASDDLPAESMRRDPRPPFGGFDALIDDSSERRPLGSRSTTDTEGWVDLGALDRRSLRPDVAFPPSNNVLPVDDDLVRGDPIREQACATVEGLLKTNPGRYLWLRINLRGTRRRAPALYGMRVTWDRPSLLNNLPAFWRADPVSAKLMDEWLCLFEGNLTELGDRVDSLPTLFHPRACPPEVLEWLASFIALVFDRRLGEATRRQLLIEGISLYKQRGTVPGLERLLTILSGGEVQILEGYRMRGQRVASAFVGEDGDAPDERGAVVGEGLRLGGDESGTIANREPWEQELLGAHFGLLQRRAADDDPCPGEQPALPIDLNPLISWYRRSAHRFQVLLYAPCSTDLQDIIESAIEANKPAHTVHELCWMDQGLSVGLSSLVGLGTRLLHSSRFQPAVLDRSPVGSPSTLSSPDPAARLGTFVGGSRVGVGVRLG